MRAEIGVAAVMAGKPVGQKMRVGRDVGLANGAQFGAGRGWQHGDAGIAGNEAVLPLDGVAVLPLRFFGAGTFSTAAMTRLLSRFLMLRPGLAGSPRPPMKVSSASRKGSVRNFV
jgi:hypothetical protein